MSDLVMAQKKASQDDQFDILNSDYDSNTKKNPSEYVTANFPTQSNKKNELAVSPKK